MHVDESVVWHIFWPCRECAKLFRERSPWKHFTNGRVLYACHSDIGLSCNLSQVQLASFRWLERKSEPTPMEGNSKQVLCC